MRTARSSHTPPPKMKLCKLLEEDSDETLSKAIEVWKDKMLKGLSLLTEEDIEEALYEFREFLTREYATQEDLDEVDRLVDLLEEALLRLMDQQHTEALIIAAKDPEEENERECIAKFLASQMPRYPLQPRQETVHTAYNSKQVSRRYESMLSEESNKAPSCQ